MTLGLWSVVITTVLRCGQTVMTVTSYQKLVAEIFLKERSVDEIPSLDLETSLLGRLLDFLVFNFQENQLIRGSADQNRQDHLLGIVLVALGLEP